MGKPSSTQISKKSSSHSLNATMSREKMSGPMRNHKKKKGYWQKRKHTQQKIQKLFKDLRNETLNTDSLDTTDTKITFENGRKSETQITPETQKPPEPQIASEVSVIELEDSLLNNTVISVKPSKKRKRSLGDSTILIPDDDSIQQPSTSAPATPKRNFKMHHSTPIAKRAALDDLILHRSDNNIHSLKKDVENLTREINRDSYLTIDLTTESSNRTNMVDQESDAQDCMLVSVSNEGSMSGDSDVTVLQNRKPMNRQVKNFTNRINNLNASEKGKLLELITQKIFSGCNLPENLQNNLTSIRDTITRVNETVEDTYIKEVILGRKASRNSIGSNIYHPDRKFVSKSGLRMVVIDGSNVAMQHGRGVVFSVKGLRLCIDYFRKRGHIVKAFVPRFRCKFGKSTDGRLLDHLERQGLVVYTPSREIQGRMVTSYDDRYIVQCAAEFDGVIVSGDNYRDLLDENPRWRSVIENRLLPFTWVEDMIMFPKDPLGRDGPTLEQFLRHPEGDAPQAATGTRS